MRGKRSKQYRKLMQQYGLNFGFREPYQVLVDGDIIKDADRFKMDLVGGLERTLHGSVKPMITQCCMRHLYATSTEPGMSFIIDKAKLFERRRCNHLPEEYPEPLSAVECISSVVDPKGSKTNKHRYVVASQDIDVRKAMRGVMGVPLIYINRSVMIMEPMAGATVQNRDKEERSKFRDGIKSRASGSQNMKRKRADGDAVNDGGDESTGESTTKKKKTHGKGPKGPNPLAVKKSRKLVDGQVTPVTSSSKEPKVRGSIAIEASVAGDDESANKRKRRRKHKPVTIEGQVPATDDGERESEK